MIRPLFARTPINESHEIGRRPIRVDTRRRPTINFIELSLYHFECDTTHTHTHIQSKPFASFSVLFYFPFHSYQSNLIAPSSQRRSIRTIWGHVDAVFRIIMSIRSICCFDSAFQVKILESMWICHALKWPMYLYIIQSTYGLAFAKCIRFASKLRRTENYTIIHSRVHPYGWGKNIFAL